MLFLAIFCLSAAAGQSVVRVDSVVISASREARNTVMQSLDNEQLTALSSGSVAEAMRHFSGVRIKDYGGVGGMKTVDVHGLGSQHTGVFYDGIALGNAQNGVVDLGRFSLENIADVRLYNGSAGSIFLSAKQLASSSGLYIEPRKPQFSEGKTNNFRGSIKGGSFATINPATVWERRFSSRVSGSVSAEGLYSSGKYRFRYAREGGWDTVGMRTNGDVRFLRIEASAMGNLHHEGGNQGSQKTGEWSARAYFYASERGYPGAVIKRAEDSVPPPDDRQGDVSFFAQTTVRQRFTSFYSLRAQAKAAWDGTRYNSQRFRQSEFYLSAANLFDLARRWSASLSADIQYNTLAAEISPRVDELFPDPRRLTIFASAATALDLRKVNIQASVLWTATRDFGKNTASQKGIFSPSVSASWSVSQSLSVRAMFKKTMRLPTFNDLYYNDLGNRSLRPEFAVQWSAGAEFLGTFLTASVDAYINRVRDKIVATPTANQFSWTMLNLGKVEIRGVDAVVEPRFCIANLLIKSRLSYTFQDASRGDAVPYLPRHSGSFGAVLSWPKWSAGWSAIFTGIRYRIGSQTVMNRLDAWHTHDVSVGRELGKAKISIHINNIFNRRYEVVRWYPMPGTNFKLNLTISL